MDPIRLLDLKREYEYLKPEIDSAIERCLKHQEWVLGPEVERLEKEISTYLGVKHGIGVSSGTDALVISLRALALQRKKQEYFSSEDEIITTPFTFVATADAILRSGATPVFVDIDPRSFNLDVRLLERYLKSKPSGVVGIISVHLYGQACEMDGVMQLAREYDLFVLEDVAQAFGGKWKTSMLGSIGDVAALSFFPTKNLGGFGDGGMVVTGDDDLCSLVRMLTKHGGKDKYHAEHVGYNARLDTVQAAVLLVKLKHIAEFIDRRRKIAQVYNDQLSQVKRILLPSSLPEAFHVYNQYAIRILNGKRDALRNHLSRGGIDSTVYYPLPLHRMKLFQGRARMAGPLKQAEKAAAEVLSLPIDPFLSGADVERIIDQVKKFVGGCL